MKELFLINCWNQIMKAFKYSIHTSFGKIDHKAKFLQMNKYSTITSAAIDLLCCYKMKFEVNLQEFTMLLKV